MSSTDVKIRKKRIYVGNLEEYVTTKDLIELFGLNTTIFLERTCSVELMMSPENSSKFENYAIVNVPEEIHSEIIKLNGIEFYGRQLFIEDVNVTQSEKRSDDQKEDIENEEENNKGKEEMNRRRVKIPSKFRNGEKEITGNETNEIDKCIQCRRKVAKGVYCTQCDGWWHYGCADTTENAIKKLGSKDFLCNCHKKELREGNKYNYSYGEEKNNDNEDQEENNYVQNLMEELAEQKRINNKKQIIIEEQEDKINQIKKDAKVDREEKTKMEKEKKILYTKIKEIAAKEGNKKYKQMNTVEVEEHMKENKKLTEKIITIQRKMEGLQKTVEKQQETISAKQVIIKKLEKKVTEGEETIKKMEKVTTTMYNQERAKKEGEEQMVRMKKELEVKSMIIETKEEEIKVQQK